MNTDNEKERPMPLDQDAETDAEATAAPRDSEAPKEGPRPGTTDVQAYIGRQLRAVYDDVVKQPIPDRFLALMKQLEEQGPKG